MPWAASSSWRSRRGPTSSHSHSLDRPVGGIGLTLPPVITRLFFRLVMLAIAAGIVALISWVLAYTTVANVLGSPPPEMGTQTTVFLWKGMPRVAGHPRAWRFSFFPTKVPGSPTVRIYVSPTGPL